MTSATPRAVRLDVAKNRLEIDWEDGTTSAWSGGRLRHLCPCAGCRGHSPGEVEGPRWEDVKDVRVTNAEAVGAYALRFAFSDHHATGIYSWDWLRRTT